MNSNLPHIIKMPVDVNVADWTKENLDSLNELLSEFGAVLLRSNLVPGVEAFRKVVETFCTKALPYVYRSTPRTDLGDGLYTATEYPPRLPIPFHNENSFQREWPLLLLFYCVDPTEDGSGQTPLADTIEVTSRIDKRILRRFAEKNVMYIRNYSKDIDLTWETVFQTSSRQEVDNFCKDHDIECEWKSDGSLRTKQVCQGLAVNPRDKRRVWFNQAHLFHPSSLDGVTRDLMNEMFRPEDFPRNATYGDGTEMDESILEEIRGAFNMSSTEFLWKKGDILVIDNMRVSHARTPYRGHRKILTSMGNLFIPVFNKLRPETLKRITL